MTTNYDHAVDIDNTSLALLKIASQLKGVKLDNTFISSTIQSGYDFTNTLSKDEHDDLMYTINFDRKPDQPSTEMTLKLPDTLLRTDYEINTFIRVALRNYTLGRFISADTFTGMFGYRHKNKRADEQLITWSRLVAKFRQNRAYDSSFVALILNLLFVVPIFLNNLAITHNVLNLAESFEQTPNASVKLLVVFLFLSVFCVSFLLVMFTRMLPRVNKSIRRLVFRPFQTIGLFGMLASVILAGLAYFVLKNNVITTAQFTHDLIFIQIAVTLISSMILGVMLSVIVLNIILLRKRALYDESAYYAHVTPKNGLVSVRFKDTQTNQVFELSAIVFNNIEDNGVVRIANITDAHIKTVR